MPHEAYCIAYQHNRWTVSHRGRDLGSFYFRAKALKFAVEAAHWSAAMDCPTIYILDRTGDLYTAWRGDRDVITSTI
jgi:hypothetical protein